MRLAPDDVENRLPGQAIERRLVIGLALILAHQQFPELGFDWSREEMWEKQGAISGPVFASEDAKEGASAFKEKRDPVWQGR